MKTRTNTDALSVPLHRFVRPFRLQSGKIVEQQPNTRKLRRNERARSTDLAWTEPQDGWLPVEKYLIGRPAHWFKGVVRPNAASETRRE